MMCENMGRGMIERDQAARSGLFSWGHTDGALGTVLSRQSNAHSSSPSLHGFYGMAQDVQPYSAASNHNVPGTIIDGSSSFDPGSGFDAFKLRGLWCPGIQSDAAREYSSLCSKNGWTLLDNCKPEIEIGMEGGVLVVRSQACPWSRVNLDTTHQYATTDALRYQKLLTDAFFMDHVQMPSQARSGEWCKHCAMLEKYLFTKLNPEEMPADEDMNDTSFKRFGSFSDTDLSYSSLDSRRRKHELEDWESDRARVLWKITELTNRANRAEQRVMELEQLLQDNAVMLQDDASVDSVLIGTHLPQREISFEARSEQQLVCKLPGCNKLFKSSKTLRRHMVQKHSDNARFLVCNQPTVNGVICRFETIHSGVLSYHRKHSLAHQRREDWHISCPFCQSKFARQHEMDRHQRICKSRPKEDQTSPQQQQQHSTEIHLPVLSISEGPNLSHQLQNSSLNSRQHRFLQQHHHHHDAQLLLPNNQNENQGLTSTFMIPSAHVLGIDSSSPSLF